MRKINVILGLVVSMFLMSSPCYAQEWAITYGGIDAEVAYSIDQTTDSGFIVAGDTESFGPGAGDVWVLKLNSDGTVEWQKCYGGIHGGYEYRAKGRCV